MPAEPSTRSAQFRPEVLVATSLGRLCLILAVAIPILNWWTGLAVARHGLDGGLLSLLGHEPGAALSLLLFCAWLVLSTRLLHTDATPRDAESDTPEPEATPAADGTAAMTSASRGHKTILLADDNAVNRRVAGLMLTKAGYRVEEARDGREAVERVEAGGQGLVLLDIHMPRMDGYEAVSAIRAIDGPMSSVPVLAMTASAMTGDVDRCLEAGMDGYVSKPVRGIALLAAVESWFDGKDLPCREMERAVHTPAHPTMKNNLPTLSLHALDELRAYGGDEGETLLVELGETFMQGARERLVILEAAFENNDRQELERSTHTLKGSAGTLGAKRLEEMCRVLEEDARSGHFPANRQPLDRIREEIEAVRQALNLEINGLAV